MLRGNDHADHVAARLLDFFDTVIPWPRRLWSVGLVLSAHEVLEATDAVAEGVLSDAALDTLCKTTFEVALRDRGLDPSHREPLKQCLLKADVRPGSGPYFTLRHLISEISTGYLTRWADALASPDPPDSETTARSVAAFLLDRGFSSQYLHKWWSYRTAYQQEQHDLVDILREAEDDLAQRSPRPIAVFVPFTAIPGRPWTNPQWLHPREAATWLLANGFTTPVRHNGALLLEIEGLDPWAAVARAVEHIDRLHARVTLGTDKQLLPAGEAYVPGYSKSFPLRRRRRVHVGALQRQAQVLTVQQVSPVDAALALLAPLQEQPPPSAVTGSWAAVEGLLIGPREGNHSQAARRLAALVACSWPRAELTALAHAYRRTARDDLSAALDAMGTNRERSRLMADTLKAGGRLRLSRATDRASQTRMTRLLQEPQATLLRVEEYLTRAFLRLYRQRNLVLHGGRTETECVALQATLRTVAPLVGAAFDRITHAWLEGRITPIELAAKAQLRIDTLGSAGARHITELLE